MCILIGSNNFCSPCCFGKFSLGWLGSCVQRQHSTPLILKSSLEPGLLLLTFPSPFEDGVYCLVQASLDPPASVSESWGDGLGLGATLKPVLTVVLAQCHPSPVCALSL